jgi:membrane protein YdbS with pleckstrin-like domain|tara:strand:+ start:17 stop:223 length:207 start_codon:yes stop_codon:yes gene_type:complete
MLEVVLETDGQVLVVMVVLVVVLMLVQDWRHQVIEWEFLELEVEVQEHKLMNIQALLKHLVVMAVLVL